MYQVYLLKRFLPAYMMVDNIVLKGEKFPTKSNYIQC